MTRRRPDAHAQEDRAAGRAAYKLPIKCWQSQKAAAIDLEMSDSTLSGHLSDDPDREVTCVRLRRAVLTAIEMFGDVNPDDLITDVIRVLFDRPTGEWISGARRPTRAPVLETMDVVAKATRLAERQLQGDATQGELNDLAADIVREAREMHAAVAK